jgi:peptidoglycan-associated lipoprotein
MMPSILRTSLLLGVVSITAIGSVRAQAPTPAPAPGHKAAEHKADRPEVDIAVTYLSVRSNLTPGQFFWQQGGDVELAATVYRGFGLAMNIAGSEGQHIAGSGVDLDMVTATFGPRYTLSLPSRKLALFGQGLVGISNAWNSVFPETTGATADANSVALQLGGGADLLLSPHWAVRPIQADWVRTQFPNATTSVQNNLRLSAGVVFRFPQKR